MIRLLIAASLAIQGTWIKPCESRDEGHWVQEHLVVSGNVWTRDTIMSEDPNCTGGEALTLRRVWTTSLDGSQLDMSLETISFRPETTSAAEALNSVSYCGSNDWKKQEFKDVTGHQCHEQIMPVHGERTFSMAYVSRFEPDFLWLGEATEDYDGTSPATRHANFESFAFERENAKGSP